jgi:ABC-2 type transport system permease protein
MAMNGQAAKTAFDHAFRSIFKGRRTVLIALAGCVPILIAVIWRMTGALDMNPAPIAMPGINMFEMMIASSFLHFYILLYAIFFGTALFGDEVDNRTLVYLLMKPISRMTLVLGKFATYLVCGLMLVIPYVIALYLILVSANGFRALQDNLNLLCLHSLVLFMALLTYGALFTFLGALTRFAIYFGIALCFLWEQVLVFIPAPLKKWTIMYYLQCLFPRSQGGHASMEIFTGTTPPGHALAVLFAVTVTCLILAGFTLVRKEYNFK